MYKNIFPSEGMLEWSEVKHVYSAHPLKATAQDDVHSPLFLVDATRKE